MNRGAGRRDIFKDDEDFQTYLRLLISTVVSYQWQLLAFCLMPNHIHLLLNTPLANLGRGMQWLHSRYVTYFNRRYSDRGGGTIFRAPYRARRPITSEEKFIQLLGYIAVNPVRARLCEAASDWPWSSHSLIAAGEAPPWLSQGLVLDRLEGAVGFPCYDELIAAHERHALTFPKGSEPFWFGRQ
jgi:REP element-mobilizing transposase RayT